MWRSTVMSLPLQLVFPETRLTFYPSSWRHDTQQNDIWQKDYQNNDNQQNDIWH
jgi:hypothetical protein